MDHASTQRWRYTRSCTGSLPTSSSNEYGRGFLTSPSTFTVHGIGLKSFASSFGSSLPVPNS